MAGGTLPGVMVAGFVATVAALAIGLPRVTETDAAGPVGCTAMAGGTLPGVVVAGFIRCCGSSGNRSGRAWLKLMLLAQLVVLPWQVEH